MSFYNMKQGSYIILIIMLVLCSGCRKKLYNLVDDYVSETNDSTINMSDIIKEEWDTMFVFPPTSNLRPRFQKYQDIARRIVFVKGDHIVYQEDEVAVETAHKVTFDTDAYFFTPHTAIFDVQRIDSENNGVIYFLHPTKKE